MALSIVKNAGLLAKAEFAGLVPEALKSACLLLEGDLSTSKAKGLRLKVGFLGDFFLSLSAIVAAILREGAQAKTRWRPGA